MKTQPYWSATSRPPKFPSLKGDLKVDVVVIGGGITGATAAHLLKKAGATVALLERDRCGSAETGHTTAHLTYVTDTRLHELVQKFGRDHAQAAWDGGRAAMKCISQIVEDEGIGCEFAWVPGYLHAPLGQRTKEEEIEAMREDAQLSRELGFDGRFTEKVPLMEKVGVCFSDQAKFHPVKYLTALLRTIPGGGCHVFENSEVSQIEVEPLKLKANGYTISCRYVFVATHVPLQGATGTVSAALFQTKLAPYTSYAVGARIPPGVVGEASFWDTADPYFYLRIDRRKGYEYAILGGADHKTGQVRDPEKNYARVEQRMRR